MSSEPPEEPQYRNEPSILSPASPKPIHFPTPTNIPVLEMQHDEGFNQTETHMNDPASRNTELRPNLWRDPNDEPEAAVDLETAAQEHMEATGPTLEGVTPHSTGAEHASAMEIETLAGDGLEGSAKQQSNSFEAASTDNASTTNQISASDREPPMIHTDPTDSVHDRAPTMEQTLHGDPTGLDPSSDPSVPAAEVVAATVAQDVMTQDKTDTLSNTTVAPAFNPTSVDVQALLDTLQTSPSAAAHTTQDPISLTLPAADTPSSAHEHHPAAVSSPTSASGFGAPPTGLPPRPPPQEQPLIHPNYVHSQHIRDYHPHAANPAFQPHGRTGSSGNIAEPGTKNFVPPVHSPTAAPAPAPGIQQQSPSQYTSPIPSFSNGQAAQSSHGANQPYTTTPTTNNFGAFAGNNAPGYGMYAGTPIESRREHKIREGEQLRPEDRPWDAEVQRKYDRFIEEERRYVSEGRWEQFPNGARLFVGNLSSEKVTKRDIFHVFHIYGELAQISIKQAYGFVQFLRAEDCQYALESEQGTQIRDKRIHLEVSKPQKNRPQNNQRRSRSPPDRNRGRQGNNVDRYTSGSRGSASNNRDAYRPGYRSPSPRGYRDRYDDRYRARSRSPTYGRGGNRYRSPSPRRDVDDDLPLPKRNPTDVPDVQIIVLDQLDRDFISWVEQAFTSRSVRADVLLLSPRLSEQAVVRRQIMEGVVAVVKLSRQNQNTGKIGLQIFDRSKGVSNVSFDEYDGLDPGIAVELVLRAKNTNAAPAVQQGYSNYPGQQQNYGGYPAQSYNAPQQPSYPPQTAHHPSQYPQQSAPPPSSVPPNLQSLITNLDPNNLQSLLSAMNTPQSGTGGNPYSGGGAPASAVQALQQNPAMVSYLQQQQAQQQQPPTGAGAGQLGQQVDMQDILARLGSGNYQR